MTDAVAQVLITTIPTAIGSITTAALAYASWRQSVANSVKVQENIGKSDTLIEKAVEIHTLTNSSLSTATSTNTLLASKIEGLERLITSMTAAKEAAVKVSEQQNDTSPQLHDGSSSEKSLEKIDTNTANIEKNTAKTKVDVQKLTEAQ